MLFRQHDGALHSVVQTGLLLRSRHQSRACRCLPVVTTVWCSLHTAQACIPALLQRRSSQPSCPLLPLFFVLLPPVPPPAPPAPSL